MNAEEKQKERERLQKQAQAVKDLSKLIFLEEVKKLRISAIAKSEDDLKNLQSELRMQFQAAAASSVSAAIQFQRLSNKLITEYFSAPQDENN